VFHSVNCSNVKLRLVASGSTQQMVEAIFSLFNCIVFFGGDKSRVWTYVLAKPIGIPLVFAIR
jgi:hypothetical protein